MKFRVPFMPDRLSSTAGQHGRTHPGRSSQLSTELYTGWIIFGKSFVDQGFSLEQSQTRCSGERKER